MGFFTKRLCIYCKQSITWLDRFFGNEYEADPGKWAHAKCRVEPKVGE